MSERTMPETFVIATVGKHTVKGHIDDAVYGALLELRADASNEERRLRIVDAIMGLGKLEQHQDHGDRFDKATHQ